MKAPSPIALSLCVLLPVWVSNARCGEKVEYGVTVNTVSRVKKGRHIAVGRYGQVVEPAWEALKVDTKLDPQDIAKKVTIKDSTLYARCKSGTWTLVEKDSGPNRQVWISPKLKDIEGRRVYAVVAGNFGGGAGGGGAGRGGGGGGGGGEEDKPDWYSLAVDLDMDADSNNDGKIELDNNGKKAIEEDRIEADTKRLGALAILKGRTVLRLRRLLEQAPGDSKYFSDLCSGTVTIKPAPGSTGEVALYCYDALHNKRLKATDDNGVLIGEVWKIIAGFRINQHVAIPPSDVDLEMEGTKPGDLSLVATLAVRPKTRPNATPVTFEDKVKVTVVTADLEGPKVYDPKLTDAGKVAFRYKVDVPGDNFKPAVELTVRDGATDVACLVRKTEAPPVPGQEIIKQWDGKWGYASDGKRTQHFGKFADPKKYQLQLALYLDPKGKTPILVRPLDLFVVRLGVVAVGFEDAGRADEEYDLTYHLRTKKNTEQGAGNDFRVRDPVWKIGPDRPKDRQDKGDLDKKDGTPRPEAPPHDMLNFPEQDSTDGGGVEDDNFNRPVCYKVRSKAQIVVTIGSQAVSQLPGNRVLSPGYGGTTGCPLIKLAPEGYKDDPGSAGDNLNIQPQGTYRLEAEAALGNDGKVTMKDLHIKMLFHYKDGENWRRIPGHQKTSHKVYLTFAKPIAFAGMRVPWVKVMHRGVEWAQAVAHRHDLGGGRFRPQQPGATEKHEPTSKENIAENMMWRMGDKGPELNWNFGQGDPQTFEERWRRMTAVPPIAYDPDNAMDEPKPTSGVLGGDCFAWAHTMSDVLGALGIGSGLGCCNEKPAPNMAAPRVFTGRDNTGSYRRLAFGGGAWNNWQGVCILGGIGYSVQGPHISRYAIMNNAPSRVRDGAQWQGTDHVHAFNYYGWRRTTDRALHLTWKPPGMPPTNASTSNLR
jgi:hypothetical protein